MGKSRAPTPPDPIQTAQAQTGTNVATAVANTNLGNVSQYGPTGSLEYSQSGTTNFTDPATGATFEIPQFSATTTLSPQQQAIFDQNQGAQLGLANIANSAAGRLGDHLGGSVDQGALPQRSQLPSELQGYGASDFSEDRQRTEQAIMDRLQPYLDRDREAMDTRLANQGIGLGARAYGAAQDDFSRATNDARLGAILAGGQEQSRLVGLDRDQASFDNANTLNLSAAQDAQRAQALQETFAQRNQPINEITALLSGSQVAVPNFQVNRPTGIPTTDFAGLTLADYQNRVGQYNAQQGNLGSILGAGATLLGAPSGSILGGFMR